MDEAEHRTEPVAMLEGDHGGLLLPGEPALFGHADQCTRGLKPQLVIGRRDVLQPSPAVRLSDDHVRPLAATEPSPQSRAGARELGFRSRGRQGRGQGMVEDAHGLAVHLLPGVEERVVIDLLVLVGIIWHVTCRRAGRDGTVVAGEHTERTSTGLGRHATRLLLRTSDLQKDALHSRADPLTDTSIELLATRVVRPEHRELIPLTWRGTLLLGESCNPPGRAEEPVGEPVLTSVSTDHHLWRRRIGEDRPASGGGNAPVTAPVADAAVVDHEPGRRSTVLASEGSRHVLQPYRAATAGCRRHAPAGGQEGSSCVQTVPFGTTHSMTWPVTAAIRSKSSS
jgi:hypothetical protein